MDDQIREAYDEYGGYLRNLTRPLLIYLRLSPGEHKQIILEAIWKAIKSYDPERSVFRAHLTIVALNLARTEYTMAKRFKHIPLDSAVSLDTYHENKDGKKTRPVYQIQAPNADQFDLTWKSEHSNVPIIIQWVKENTTELEWGVFVRHILNKKSYGQIAHELGCSWKAVDNAAQRIKTKLGKRRKKLESRLA